jgi:hypothetical protein
MEPTTPKTRTLLFHLLLCLSLASMLQTVSAVDVEIDSIHVDVPEEITPGGNFNVVVNFENPDDTDSVSVRIKIEIEGLLVYDDDHSISFTNGVDRNYSISSGSFDDIWDDNLMAYNCGSNRVEVTVSGDNDEINTESDAADFDITPSGDEDEKTLNMDIDPSNPQIDDDITITIKNENGDEVSGVSVKFTWVDDNEKGVWEADDLYEDASKTGSDGETIFNIEDDFKGEYGKYQVDAWKSGYCKATETFAIVQGELTVGNPEPSNPKVGEQFKLKVTDGTNPLKGVRGVISDINVRQTSTSGDDGYLKFTINKAGTYTILINASNYELMEKQVMVSTPDALTVSITPTPAEVNDPVNIAVFSKSSPVSGVSLTVTRPDGGKDVLSTGSDGRASYTPKKTGTFKVDASKDNYQQVSETFSVNSAFNVVLPDEKTIVYGSELTITLVDAETKVPVAGALMSGTGIPSLSKTNTMGQYTMKLGSSGQYSFIVSKDGYADKGFSVTALCVLNLKTNATTVELEQPVRISVYDKEKGEYVSGNIAVSKPDGTSDAKTGEEYALTPSELGTYGIKISKANCVGDEGVIEAKTRGLRFESELKEGKILVRTISGGKPVAGVEVEVKTPSGASQQATSDENGLLTVNAVESGDYNITSTDSRYSAERLTVEQKGSALKKYWWAIAVAGIILLIVVLLALIALLFLRSRGSKEDSSFDKARSKLG